MPNQNLYEESRLCLELSIIQNTQEETKMSEETIRCPNCKTGMLSTPIIRPYIEDERKSIGLPIKYCRFCDIIIPTSKNVKFWNGKEAIQSC